MSECESSENFHDVVAMDSDMGYSKHSGPVGTNETDSRFTHYSVNVIPNLDLNDFGYVLARQSTAKLSQEELRCAFQDHWIPTKENDFPVSYHKKEGKVRPRRLSDNHIRLFPWLVVSKHPSYSGAWCKYCVLFKTSLSVASKQITHPPIGLPLIVEGT